MNGAIQIKFDWLNKYLDWNVTRQTLVMNQNEFNLQSSENQIVSK